MNNKTLFAISIMFIFLFVIILSADESNAKVLSKKDKKACSRVFDSLLIPAFMSKIPATEGSTRGIFGSDLILSDYLYSSEISFNLAYKKNYKVIIFKKKDGSIVMKARFLKDRPDGLQLLNYQNKTITVNYLKGKREGLIKCVVTKNSQPCLQANFINDKLNGDLIFFDQQHVMDFKAEYKNGLIDGLVKSYYKGKLLDTSKLPNGTGVYKVYVGDKLKAICPLKKGLQDGMMISYEIDSNKINGFYEYEKGMLHGIAIDIYYEDKELWIVNWRNNVACGPSFEISKGKLVEDSLAYNLENDEDTESKVEYEKFRKKHPSLPTYEALLQKYLMLKKKYKIDFK